MSNDVPEATDFAETINSLEDFGQFGSKFKHAPHSNLYVTSKLAAIPMWQNLRQRGLPINSRWIDQTIDLASEEAPHQLGYLWQSIIMGDVPRADLLLVYLRQGEVLKGGLLEIGIALHLSMLVIVVTNMSMEEFIQAVGTWPRHPHVRFNSGPDIDKVLAEALLQEFDFTL